MAMTLEEALTEIELIDRDRDRLKKQLTKSQAEIERLRDIILEQNTKITRQRIEIDRLRDCDSLCGPDQNCCYAGELRAQLAEAVKAFEYLKRNLWTTDSLEAAAENIPHFIEYVETALAKIRDMGSSGGSTSPRAGSELRPTVEPGDPTHKEEP